MFFLFNLVSQMIISLIFADNIIKGIIRHFINIFFFYLDEELWFFLGYDLVYDYIYLGYITMEELSSLRLYIVMSSIFSFAMIIPNIALIVRRLHDLGKPAFFCLGFFVPYLIGDEPVKVS